LAQKSLKRGKEMKRGSRPTTAFIGVLIFGFALYFFMLAIEPNLKTVLFDYKTWDELRTDNALYRFLWMMGDSTEPHFHKTLLGSIGLLIGTIIAYFLDKQKSRLRGIPISYGNGHLWPWIFAAGFLSLGISVILFGGLHIDGDAYVPTFVPYVSVASAVILLYGGSLRTLFTGAILGAFLTTPISLYVRYELCLPNELPGVIAAVTGMWLGGILTFEICKILPWMHMPEKSETNSTPETIPEEIPEAMTLAEYKVVKPNKFFIRRMLADYTEPMFVGNEIAGLFLILGTLITWFLSPLQPSYGTGLLPHILLSQVITGAVAMYVYWEGWRDNAWFPTFVPVVSVAPACILLYGGTMPVIIIAAILGGLFCPPVANLINRSIPKHWHIFVGLTFSMALCTLIVAIILKYVGMILPIF